MKTLYNVVLFVLVLFVAFGSVVPVEAQEQARTQAERDAYTSLDNAVEAAQSEPTTERFAAVGRMPSNMRTPPS